MQDLDEFVRHHLKSIGQATTRILEAISNRKSFFSTVSPTVKHILTVSNISVGNKFFILSSGGSVFIEKLVPGEQILGGTNLL